ncbi:flagellar hook-length control protein FliK [Rhodovulum sp. DZ06]|uniref:flagellar hook-length control protein FliK n=1 Tax=Rhodovulum sp. DZ06 TaxID=3425126 RepID=UPI003D32EFD0
MAVQSMPFPGPLPQAREARPDSARSARQGGEADGPAERGRAQGGFAAALEAERKKHGDAPPAARKGGDAPPSEDEAGAAIIVQAPGTVEVKAGESAVPAAQGPRAQTAPAFPQSAPQVAAAAGAVGDAAPDAPPTDADAPRGAQAPAVPEDAADAPRAAARADLPVAAAPKDVRPAPDPRAAQAPDPGVARPDPQADEAARQAQAGERAASQPAAPAASQAVSAAQAAASQAPVAQVQARAAAASADPGTSPADPPSVRRRQRDRAEPPPTTAAAAPQVRAEPSEQRVAAPAPQAALVQAEGVRFHAMREAAADAAPDPIRAESLTTQASVHDGPRAMTATVAAAAPDRPQAAAVAAQLAPALRRGGDGSTEIRLDPPELGRVRVTLRTDEAGLVATITAERPETVDLMRRHADLLLRDLAANGQARVDLSFGSFGGNGGDGEKGGGRFAAAGASILPEAAPDERRAPRRLGDGLDIRV